MKTLESYLVDVGGCGRFQVSHILAINAVRLVAVFGISFMAFGNYNPGWRCRDGVVNNRTLSSPSFNPKPGIDHSNRQPLSDPGTFGDATTVRTSRFRRDWTFSDTDSGADISTSKAWPGHDSLSYSAMVTGANASSGYRNGIREGGDFRIGCRNFSSCSDVEFDPRSRTVVTEWGLTCDSSWIVTFIIFIQMVGFFFGCTSAGQVSERFGRRKTLFGNAGLYFLANAVAVFSLSWHMHAACLFCIGIGAGGVLTVALVYSFEFLDPRWRGILGGFPLMNIAMTVFSLLAFVARDWQYLHVAISVASGLSILSVFWVCESVRWLAVHGRTGKAKVIVHKMASTNRLPRPEDDVLLEILKKAAAGGDLERTSAEFESNQKKYTYVDLFRERSLRWMTVRLALGWLCEVTVYYALHFSAKVFSGDFYVNLFIYSVVEIPVVVLIGPLANRIGRKHCCAGCFFVACLCCTALALIKLVAVSDTSGRALAILVLAVAAKAAISGGRCCVSILTIELPPTVVRNLSYGFCMLFSRFGTMIAPYLVPERDTFLVSFSIMAVLMLLTSVLFLTLPETKDRPMADTLAGRTRSQS